MFANAKKILATTLALAASIYASERLYLAPFNMVGLNEDFGTAAERIMNAYIEDDGRFVLVNYTEEDSVKVGDRESANQKAIAHNCSKYLMAEFTRLGENVITSFKLYDVNKDAVIWSDRLKAKNPDDFDPIIQRVARNIGTKRKATNDNDIYSVTEQETKAPRKKGISSYYGVEILGDVPINAPKTHLSAGIGFFMFYDARDFFFSCDLTMSNMSENRSSENDKASLFDLGLSLYYPFGTSNITPFAGGGLAYSWRTTSSSDYDFGTDQESDGLSAKIGGGVVFNRASRIMFIAQVDYFFDFFTTPFYKKTDKKTDNGQSVLQKNNYYLNGLKFGLGLALGF